MEGRKDAGMRPRGRDSVSMRGEGTVGDGARVTEEHGAWRARMEHIRRARMHFTHAASVASERGSVGERSVRRVVRTMRLCAERVRAR